jgi:uracil-DNA glycosylase
MSDNTRDQSLAVLRWLMEAGADEAVSDAPVNRFAQPASPTLPPANAPLRGARTPSPTRGEGKNERGVAAARAPEIGTSSAAQAVSLSTAPGAARALAQSCTTLAELKTALMNF